MTDFPQPVSGTVVPRFGDVATFMRLPLFRDPAEVEIGIVGVPWDGGTTNRPGARHGPRQRRDLSTMMRRVHHVTGVAPYELAKCGDIGDAPVNPASLKAESERLFYRTAEIRARARLVNQRYKPDLVLALHFNAEAWGNPARPTLTGLNHLHLLVSGCYSARELEYDDQRYDLMVKLLNRSFDQEVGVSRAVAQGMARATGLPPYTYTGDTAIKVGGSPYVWARNLLANRLFECPVVYLEPYVMNNREVHDRVQLGDYSGRRKINGTPRESIYREYVRGVADGLAAYHGEN